MKRIVLAAILALGLTLATSTPAQAGGWFAPGYIGLNGGISLSWGHTGPGAYAPPAYGPAMGHGHHGYAAPVYYPQPPIYYNYAPVYGGYYPGCCGQ